MIIFTKILWSIASSFIILLSIYFSFYTRFVQFKFLNYFDCFKGKKSNIGISPFKTLMLTLGGKIGVGSVAGVALAIYIGGPGTIFWMWVITLISLPIAYLESYLGCLYKKRIGNECVGGPSYYILTGLNNVFLSKFYSFLIVISFTVGFLGIQVNTIVKSFNLLFSFESIYIGILLAFFILIIVIGGIYKISKVTSKLVPFMICFYVILCTYIIFINYDQIFPMIVFIIKSAFNFKSCFSSFLYVAFIGMQRGIFASEVGLGTGSITSASSNSIDPKKDGYLQMIGVSITTLIICTMTAFIVLLSPYQNIFLNDVNGVEIVLFAFSFHFNSFGSLFLFIFIFLFSFSTILTGYYNSSVALKFLNFRFQNIFLIIITISMVIVSSVFSSSFMWNLVDIVTAILVIVNLYAIYKLKYKIK